LHKARSEASTMKALSQGAGGLLAGLVGISIENQEDLTASSVAELRELRRCQVRSEKASGIEKPCLPQHGEIEQAFH
jgi:hypothetical protein